MRIIKRPAVLKETAGSVAHRALNTIQPHRTRKGHASPSVLMTPFQRSKAIRQMQQNKIR